MTPPSATLRTVTRGVSWVAAGHVVSQLAWFGSLLFAAGLVSPAAFGSVTIAMVIVQVAWLVVGSGTRGSFVVARQISRAQVRRALAVNVGTGLAIGVGVLLLSEPILHVVVPGADVAVLQVLAFSIALYGFSIVPLAILQKEFRFRSHALANAGSALAASAVAVALGLMGGGVWTLVARQVIFQALLALIAWKAAWPLLKTLPAGTGERAARPPAARWFFGLAVIAFVTLNLDYVIVGRFTDVAQLGIYSLAFTIAFAPMTQFAWQVGKVLFPAAARTETMESVGARTAKALRVAAFVVLPLVPLAVALAPVVLPQLLGKSWQPMILPFQILLAVGAVHALLAILREFLLGSGAVRFCVGAEMIWLAATAALLVPLVGLAGTRGAALTHAFLVIPLVVAYAVAGGRRVGSSWRALWSSVSEPVALTLAEALAGGATIVTLRVSGASPDMAWLAGAAAAGLVAAAVLARRHPRPLATGRVLVRSLKAKAAA